MGRVTDASGSALGNVYVSVYPVSSSVSIGSRWTDSNGAYATYPGPPAGRYQVYFGGASAGYLSEWYRDQGSRGGATPVDVVAGETTADVDAQLAAAAATPTTAIAGTVTAADTGLPLSLWVYALDPAGVSVRSAYASDGAFALTGLPAGPYRLRFSAPFPYVTVYFDGKPDLASADVLTVTAGVTTTNISQAIRLRRTITGTVSGSGAVPGAQVLAMRVAGEGLFTRSGYTGMDGVYRLEGLPAGGYQVEFRPPSPFVGEWFADAPSASAALTLTVAHGATNPDVDAVLSPGSVVTGVITAADTGAPLPGAYASVTATSGLLAQSTGYADMDGRYRTPGLPAGDYRVSFGAGPWTAYTSQ